MSECNRIMGTDRLNRLIGHRCVVIKKDGTQINGWLGVTANGCQYSIWDTGATERFNDEDIDFVEINFVHLK